MDDIVQAYSVAFLDTTSSRHTAIRNLDDRVRSGSLTLADQGLHPISETEFEETIDATADDITYRVLIRRVRYSRLLTEL